MKRERKERDGGRGGREGRNRSEFRKNGNSILYVKYTNIFRIFIRKSKKTKYFGLVFGVLVFICTISTILCWISKSISPRRNQV